MVLLKTWLFVANKVFVENMIFGKNIGVGETWFLVRTWFFGGKSIVFGESAPRGCGFVPSGAVFLGLSLALRSQDQFQASHWSSPPMGYDRLLIK